MGVPACKNVNRIRKSQIKPYVTADLGKGRRFENFYLGGGRAKEAIEELIAAPPTLYHPRQLVCVRGSASIQETQERCLGVREYRVGRHTRVSRYR